MLQIASELRAALPELLGHHPLRHAWVYKCVPVSDLIVRCRSAINRFSFCHWARSVPFCWIVCAHKMSPGCGFFRCDAGGGGAAAIAPHADEAAVNVNVWLCADSPHDSTS